MLLKVNSLPSADRIAALPREEGIAHSNRIGDQHWQKDYEYQKNQVFQITQWFQLLCRELFAWYLVQQILEPSEGTEETAYKST